MWSAKVGELMKISKAKKFKKNSDIRKFYNENGWISLKNYIKKEEMISIQKDLDNFYFLHTKKRCLNAMVYLNKNNKKLLHKLHTVSKKINSIKKLVNKLSEFQKILFNKNTTVLEIYVGYMISLPKDKRLVYNFHQESNYMKDFKDILNIHFPIFHQSNVGNGTMSVLSKTHKLGNLNYTKKRYSNNSVTDLIPSGIEQIKEKYEEVVLELNVGDVVYFHKNLIHKSNFNYSNVCRPVGIGRFTNSFGNFKTFGNFKASTPQEL